MHPRGSCEAAGQAGARSCPGFPHSIWLARPTPGADEEDKRRACLPRTAASMAHTYLARHISCACFCTSSFAGDQQTRRGRGAQRRGADLPARLGSQAATTRLSYPLLGRPIGRHGCGVGTGQGPRPVHIGIRGGSTAAATGVEGLGRKGKAREIWDPKSRLEAGRDGPTRAWRAWRKRHRGNESLD